MTDNSRIGDIMISLSVGLLVGVAGALLLAPASGRKTRRRIGELANGVVDRAGNLTHRAGEVIKERAGRMEPAVVDGKPAPRQAQETRQS